MNQTKIKGDCQSGRKVVTYNSKSDLPLGTVNLLVHRVSRKYELEVREHEPHKSNSVLNVGQ